METPQGDHSVEQMLTAVINRQEAIMTEITGLKAAFLEVQRRTRRFRPANPVHTDHLDRYTKQTLLRDLRTAFLQKYPTADQCCCSTCDSPIDPAQYNHFLQRLDPDKGQNIKERVVGNLCIYCGLVICAENAECHPFLMHEGCHYPNGINSMLTKEALKRSYEHYENAAKVAGGSGGSGGAGKRHKGGGGGGGGGGHRRGH
jgi:uncharacterized membrane protein YgcG